MALPFGWLKYTMHSQIQTNLGNPIFCTLEASRASTENLQDHFSSTYRD